MSATTLSEAKARLRTYDSNVRAAAAGVLGVWSIVLFALVDTSPALAVNQVMAAALAVILGALGLDQARAEGTSKAMSYLGIGFGLLVSTIYGGLVLYPDFVGQVIFR